MKTKLFSSLFAIILIAGALKAAVYTVNNTPTSTIAQFSSIQAAINACAASGDTVYVHGSPNSYSGFTITNKSIVVIGPGWNPDKQWAFTANINSVISISGTLSSGTEIQGLSIQNLTIGSPIPSNIRIIRNQISNSLDANQGGSPYSNYTIEGNIFNGQSINGTSGTVYQNWLIKNNVFFRSNTTQINSLSNPLNTVVIDHNLFYGPGSNTADVFNSCGFLIITNNIFVRRDAGISNSNSTFSNNLTYHPPVTPANPQYDSPWTVNSNIDGGGNVSNQNPQMTDQTSVNSGSFSVSRDYTIAAGPANNSGVDGKDMGLLYDATGSANWANSRNSRLPRVSNFVINNPNIPAGGTLNIQVEGKKSN